MRRPARAQHGLEREHAARAVEVGRVEVEAQQPAGGERARADAERGAAERERGGDRGRSRPTSRSSVAHQSKPAASSCRSAGV